MDRFSKAKAINNQLKPSEAYQELHIDKVRVNPNNPRKHFDEESLKELASSIEEHGQQQPVTIGKLQEDGFYYIKDGGRRYEAVRISSLKTIKTLIIDSENTDVLSLITNLQRENLSDYETASAIKALLDTKEYAKKSDLAKVLGKTPDFISKALRCLRLSEDTQEAIQETQSSVSTSVMIELSKLPKEDQKKTLKDYNDKKVDRKDIIEMSKGKEHIKVKFKDSFVGTCCFSDSLHDNVEIADLEESDKVYRLLGVKSKLKVEKKYKITIEEI